MRLLLLICLLLVTIKTDHLKIVEEELIHLLHFAHKNKLMVKHWEVTYKANLTRKEAKKISRYMKAQEETNASYKNYQLMEKNNKDKMEIQYKLFLPKKKHDRAHLTISIFSEESIENPKISLKNKLNKKIVKNLPSKMDKYTCLTTENNDIMKKINLEENLSKMLNLQDIQRYDDNLRKNINVTEIYGYIKEWNGALVIHNEPINFHLVLLEKQAGMGEILIGTPILIHEY